MQYWRQQRQCSRGSSRGAAASAAAATAAGGKRAAGRTALAPCMQGYCCADRHPLRSSPQCRHRRSSSNRNQQQQAAVSRSSGSRGATRRGGRHYSWVGRCLEYCLWGPGQWRQQQQGRQHGWGNQQQRVCTHQQWQRQQDSSGDVSSRWQRQQAAAARGCAGVTLLCRTVGCAEPFSQQQ